jgi:hypothetical protein
LPEDVIVARAGVDLVGVADVLRKTVDRDGREIVSKGAPGPTPG